MAVAEHIAILLGKGQRDAVLGQLEVLKVGRIGLFLGEGGFRFQLDIGRHGRFGRNIHIPDAFGQPLQVRAIGALFDPLRDVFADLNVGRDDGGRGNTLQLGRDVLSMAQAAVVSIAIGRNHSPSTAEVLSEVFRPFQLAAGIAGRIEAQTPKAFDILLAFGNPDRLAFGNRSQQLGQAIRHARAFRKMPDLNAEGITG
jgi:hypothetical protein